MLCVICDALINWFTVYLRCILAPVCPEPHAAVRCDRSRELELYDIHLTIGVLRGQAQADGEKEDGYAQREGEVKRVIEAWQQL